MLEMPVAVTVRGGHGRGIRWVETWDVVHATAHRGGPATGTRQPERPVVPAPEACSAKDLGEAALNFHFFFKICFLQLIWFCFCFPFYIFIDLAVPGPSCGAWDLVP